MIAAGYGMKPRDGYTETKQLENQTIGEPKMKDKVKERGMVYVKTFMQGKRPSAAQKRDIISRELNGIKQADTFKCMDWLTWDVIIPRVAKAGSVEKAASKAVAVRDNRWYLNHGHHLAIDFKGKRVNVRAYVDGHRIMIHETGVWEESELKEIDGYDDVTLRFQQNLIKPLVKEVIESVDGDNARLDMSEIGLREVAHDNVSIKIDGVGYSYKYVMEAFNGAVDHNCYYKIHNLKDQKYKILLTRTKVKGRVLIGMIMPLKG